MTTHETITTAVLISANTEWRAVLAFYKDASVQDSPLGHWFVHVFSGDQQAETVLFFHGGWGKIAAAASAQYVVDRWSPALLVNLGTCGGFAGAIEQGEIILADRTVVYDIVEQMSDADEAIAYFSTDVGSAWPGDERTYPHAVRRTVLVSADRDILAGDVAGLQSKYGAVAADWESGAIAWVAARNAVRCLILRGVSDLVHTSGGEAYDGNVEVFRAGARRVMAKLIAALPAWIAFARSGMDQPLTDPASNFLSQKVLKQ